MKTVNQKDWLEIDLIVTRSIRKRSEMGIDAIGILRFSIPVKQILPIEVVRIPTLLVRFQKDCSDDSSLSK